MGTLLVSNKLSVALCRNEDEVLTIPKMRPRHKHVLAKLLEENEARAWQYARSFVAKPPPNRREPVRFFDIPASNDYETRYHVQHIKEKWTSRGRDMLGRRPKNYFLNRILAKFDCLAKKVPGETELGEWIGVEIECFIPDTSFNSLNDDLKTLRIPGIEMHHDGSIRPDDVQEDDGEGNEKESIYTTVEFTILFKKSNPEPLKRLCKFINEKGGSVNKTCGLHVHLDQRDVIGTRRLDTRIKRLKAALPVLSQMVSNSRRNNDYCKLGVSRRMGENRYYAINLCSLDKHKTIEIRLHSGTTDYNKIINWVDLLYSISRQQGLSQREISYYSDLSEALTTASADLMNYVKSRILSFDPDVQLFRGSAPLRYPQDSETVERETNELIERLDESETPEYRTATVAMANLRDLWTPHWVMVEPSGVFIPIPDDEDAA